MGFCVPVQDFLFCFAPSFKLSQADLVFHLHGHPQSGPFKRHTDTVQLFLQTFNLLTSIKIGGSDRNDPNMLQKLSAMLRLDG